MSLQSKELTQDISSLMVVALQYPGSFNNMAQLARAHNYLFYLSNKIIDRRFVDLDSPKTQADFLLGVKTYQAISMTAFPGQPTFTIHPDQLAAFELANKIGGTEASSLLEAGVHAIDQMKQQTPLLAEITNEVVARYTDTTGSRRIAMGGAATMLATHVAAEELLAA